jgi:hypothetical protein
MGKIKKKGWHCLLDLGKTRPLDERWAEKGITRGAWEKCPRIHQQEKGEKLEAAKGREELAGYAGREG